MPYSSPSPTTSSTSFPFNFCTHRVGASPRFRVARVALPPGRPPPAAETLRKAMAWRAEIEVGEEERCCVDLDV